MSDEPTVADAGDDSDDEDKAAALMGKDIYDEMSTLLNTLSEKHWMHIDPDKEPERFDRVKRIWGKGLLAALAQQLGIIEAALVVGDGLDQTSVMSVREQWIQAGHRVCLDELEEQQAEEREN